ncbi:HlyD family secretion protein [Chryseolinea lacunae]|uniref:HlyD family efflux transporter periplasmic adaptor subunit n=1 Tax=Chryseolinea lacunae TaxID=2801331 RepID=A0ABS1L0U5_9BACT|nr:HlyD family efflux transporter periplasmic adaptor subunit [Chryseolinea lacunae]MBL0745319.1 HlyD family efflux transporter periplasmic adaptor subunit [Chryseolinea lacunae]
MKRIAYLLTAFTVAACTSNKNAYDASGTFEAVETIVSAEASGTLKSFTVEEGQTLQAGVHVGFIDSVQLYLKKKQLMAQIAAVLSKKPNVAKQLAALQEQLKQAQREQQRVANLVKADAATQKQLDDATTQLDVVKKQIEAQQSTLGITTSSLTEETSPLSVQIEQLNDQLAKCKVVNPVNGTVLTKYAEAKEMTAVGKPLYKIADLSTIILRAYITGDQFAHAKLNSKVTVSVDDGKGNYKAYPGVVEWISDKAEFTPKTIQTKDERANLVYALKVRVTNDGLLKIGMYGELKF